MKGLGKKGTNLSNLGKECFGWYEVKDKKNCTQVLYSQGLLRAALVVKNLPANAGDIRDLGSISRSGRSPGKEHGNPLQYSCLEHPLDREAWWATVHSVAKSWTRLKRLSTHTLYSSW